MILWKTPNGAIDPATRAAVLTPPFDLDLGSSGPPVLVSIAVTPASPTFSLRSSTQPANPDFEVPAVGPGNFQYNPTGGSWSFFGRSGLTANGSAFTPGGPAVPEGNQVAILQETSSITQTVPGWPAGSYQLRFLTAQRADSSVQEFQVLIDGAVVDDVTPAGAFYASHTTPTFSVPAGSHAIGFLGLNPGGGFQTAFLDQVVLLNAPSLPFAATGRYSDRSTADLTTACAWSSSNPGVATIGAGTGLATIVAAGSTTILATDGSVSGSTTLAVRAGGPSAARNRWWTAALVRRRRPR